MDAPSRRRFLRLAGTAMVASLAGCGSTADPTRSPTETGTPPRSLTATRTATATDPPTASPTPRPRIENAWTAGPLAGRIQTLVLPAVGPADAPAGPLFAATQAGTVARLDPGDGRIAWELTARGGARGPPALAALGDALFVGSETFTDDRLAGHIEAVEPATGDVRWRFEDRYFLEPLGVVGDLAVVAGEYILGHPDEIGPEEAIRGDGRLHGLDRATGELRWTVDLPELRGAAVAPHGVYASVNRDPETYQLALRALNLDGTDRWRVGTGTINPGAPLATENLLLAGAGDYDSTDVGGVARYDPADGSRRWRAGTWERGPKDLAVAGGTIHAGGRPLLALGPDGREQWRSPPAVVPEVPATPETLYNGAGSSILAIDRASGTVRWRYRPDEHDYTHVRAVLADHLAINNGIGHDRAAVLLDEATGEDAATVRTADHYTAATGAGRRLFLGLGGEVRAYEVVA